MNVTIKSIANKPLYIVTHCFYDDEGDWVEERKVFTANELGIFLTEIMPYPVIKQSVVTLVPKS